MIKSNINGSRILRVRVKSANT